MTLRIRYIGDEKKTVAFEKTWVRSLWGNLEGLEEEAVAILAQNPVFEVEGWEAPKAGAKD